MLSMSGMRSVHDMQGTVLQITKAKKSLFYNKLQFKNCPLDWLIGVFVLWFFVCFHNLLLGVESLVIFMNTGVHLHKHQEAEN